ncbi:conserved hypothetical protein [Hydrogenobacter thermophilus TK-6]|uniref:Uncharacterized protein n=1 Tax=Hydrogenobacter thermophilus (strain DSM 6534 / IAM 12695 / TK-6) TaxID=608538 RepID=D3DHB9_HYDTT|nr:DUF5752 family protein [Hydrogenobacter thermophilus]ADO45159.1 conserved hypothetical protein [Hydrogenobacter thermophilus TK-6]BAI69221.1 hypothetical protein HTH_0761 [Hydrogenobacter thermophilus TK-6]
MADIFCFKTEVWVPVYTGIKVQNLQEFIQALRAVPCGSLLYHLYIHLFNYHNLPTDYPNSFSYWLASNGYEVLAEKVSSIDPTRYYDLEVLRNDILALLSESSEEKVKRPLQPFYFMSVYREVIDTSKCASNIEELLEGIKSLGISSLFYHLITSRIDKKSLVNDYSEWLLSQGYAKKAEAIDALDVYALNLYEVKELIIEVLSA